MRWLFLLFIGLLISCERSKNLDVAREITKVDVRYLAVPSAANASLPRLKAIDSSHLLLSWVTEIEGVAHLKYARYQDNSWSEVEEIASGDDWFLNWADYPNIMEHEGTLLATFLQKSAAGTYDYDVQYTVKNISQSTWSTPQTLHNDGVAAEHGFVSLSPYEDGFFATWLDGRFTKPTDKAPSSDHNHHSAAGAMTLRSAFIAKNGAVSQRQELDNRVCDCCNTAVTNTSLGTTVVYRDRSNQEKETRDIYSTTWTSEGWSNPTPVHNDRWQINGCPVNGPAIDAIGENTIVSWFTAAGDEPKVLAAFSQDGGLNYGAAIRLDAGEAVGRVTTKMLADGSAIVLWLEPNGADILIQLARVYPSGEKETPITIASTLAERASGFPQLAVIDKTAYIVWTALQDKDMSTLRFASVKFDL